MGHRDSSTALSGSGAFRASGGGTGAPAAKPRSEGLSWTARVLLTAVRVYQMFFSALMPSACKFYPSCSQYAADAVQLHGARRGSSLALRRLLRCHPFTRGGVDLVPDAPGSPPDDTAIGQTTVLANTGDTGEGYTRRPATFRRVGASATCSPPESEVHS
jgi:putative membrane protein insertion efficiency factor